jgi:hypothetical protein
MDNQQKALDNIAEVFQFEHWLRFYFVMENEADKEDLRLLVPDEFMSQIKTSHPHLHDLAELVNGTAVDYQASCDTVCSYVARKLEGPNQSPMLVTKVIDSREFQIEMYLFGLWIKGHEDYLDDKFRNFSEWQELYEGWKATDEVVGYRNKLISSQPEDQSQSTH